MWRKFLAPVLPRTVRRPPNATSKTNTIAMNRRVPQYSTGFSRQVTGEAAKLRRRFRSSIPKDREDLTNELVITIDPKDSKDFDDAISLKQLDNGNLLLGVHIADVSHFVLRGTKLDQEAMNRGLSIYLPDRVVPMLPEVLSNDLASLVPNEIRYTKTVFMEFTPQGSRVRLRFCNSAICSKMRLNYDEVDVCLQTPGKSKLPTDVATLLRQMRRLAATLRTRRLERGVLELNSTEEKGCKHATDDSILCTTGSHRMIEQFMVAANEAVAEHLQVRGHNYLARVHLSPSVKKREALRMFLESRGIAVRNLDPHELAKILVRIKGSPMEADVKQEILRSMSKARYTVEEGGHYGLASERYCHFTSPIRRYADLTVHRILDDEIRGRRSAKQNVKQLEALGQHLTEREIHAQKIERDAHQVHALTFLESRVGHTFETVVSGLAPYGVFTRGGDLAVKGLIHKKHLPKHYARSGRANRIRLGDRLKVEVAHVDIERRHLGLKLVSRIAA